MNKWESAFGKTNGLRLLSQIRATLKQKKTIH